MKAFSHILLLAATLFACACQEILGPEENGTGSGSIVLTLNAGDNISLETKTAASDLLDGLTFRNVLVILTNSSNIIVGKEYVEEEEVAGVVTPVSTKTIAFNNLSPGTYIAYAYANIDRYQWQNSSAKIEEQEGDDDLEVGDDFSGYLNRQLNSLTAAGSDVPADPVDAMLLTGKQEIVVNLTRVSGTLYLHRPVVRLNVIIDNATEYDVRVDDISFSHFNADKAFLIEHTDSDGKPVLPDGTAHRSLPAYDTANPEVVDDGEEETVYTTYLYENRSANPYKIFATLTLMRTDNPSNYMEMSLGERSFGPINFETLDAMDEGESIDVLLFNPQRSVRSGRLYCYISSENRMVWESAGYTAYDRLFGRAQAIYNEFTGVDAYNYNSEAGYTYSNANGYSSWDGIAANDGSSAYTFDYDGARSRYFHRLTKSGGLFTINGLATGNNPVSGTSIADLSIVKGNPNSDQLKKITEGVKSYLVRFENSQGKTIMSDANWSATVPNKVSYLKFDTASENQDRQFILFGKYCAGGLLNRLLSGSHREESLTYMSRNEDINITISVFYADQEGTLTFRVDNNDWTTNVITPSHTFN